MFDTIDIMGKKKIVSIPEGPISSDFHLAISNPIIQNVLSITTNVHSIFYLDPGQMDRSLAPDSDHSWLTQGLCMLFN